MLQAPVDAGGALELRRRPLYRARVRTADITDVEVVRRRDGQRTGLELGDGARLAVGGRTDVRLRFAVPVTIERPLADPFAVRELAIAGDDVPSFVAAVQRARSEPLIAGPRTGANSEWLMPTDLVAALTT